MRARVNPKTQIPRQRLNFDKGWLFHQGDLEFSTRRFPLTHWRHQYAGVKKPGDHPSRLKRMALEKTNAWKSLPSKKEANLQKSGYSWFKTALPEITGPGRTVHFTSVSDNCTVYLNGVKLQTHERWIDAFDVPLDDAWNKGGPNQLILLVHNPYSGAYIGASELETFPSKPLGPALEWFNDSHWRKVLLPHDFVVEGKFDARGDDYNGYLQPGIGWYRKRFDLPLSDQGLRLWLDFEGIFRNSRVWLNGRFLGRHRSGYTPSRYDISELIRFGETNTLSVRVDARAAEGWWYEGGGIYRHVWLNKADPLHVEPYGVYVVATPHRGRASLTIETNLVNESWKGASYQLTSEIKSPDHRTVLKLSTGGSLAANGNKTIIQKGHFPEPALWSLENPHRYLLVTSLTKEGILVDRTETPFGVRSIRFDADHGFFLNGKRVQLQGTCNHQDHAGLGVALPDRLFTYRLEKLKAMGSNAYRCAHHPHAPELLDACDRLGILVVDENRRLDDSPDVLEQVRTMVLRDRNHPSVILWSICNEEPQQGTLAGRARAEAVKKVISRYDPSRPVTAAVNYAFEGGIRDVIDIEGINYNINQYEDFRKNHPATPLYGSETASTVSTRGVYQTDPAKGYVSAYDVNHTMWSLPAEAAWRPVASRPFLAGAFIWTGFDYRGEPTPYQWPCVNSHFGIMDVCGFPKDNYYYYKSWWGKETVLHLFPHWNWKGREGKEIDVWCHGNCDRVELFLNGDLLGTKEIPKLGHLEWKVKYKPGTLLARGWKNGKIAMESKVETTSEAKSIRLTPYVDSLNAGRGDTTPVTIEILDKKGRLVPTADNLVTFRLSGPAQITGVGNGDPSSHEPDKAKKRRAFNGLCSVFIRAGETPGKIILTALSPGLTPGRLAIKSLNPGS